MTRCIEADTTLRFAVVNGVSDNAAMRWNIKETRTLPGYQSADGLMMPYAGRVSAEPEESGQDYS